MADLDYLQEAQDAIKDDLEASNEVETTEDDIPSVLELDDDAPEAEVSEPSIWDSEDESSEVEEDSEPPVDQTSDLQTLKYTADGKEYEATPEEAIKALSLMKGARRAFSERARLKRQVKELQQQSEQGAQYKKYWEDAMKAANNPEQLFEKLSGKSFSEAVDREIQRRQMYANATDEQRQLFDYEDKFTNMESQLTKFKQDSEKREKELAEQASQSKRQYLSSIMEPSFHEHTADLENRFTPLQANKLKKSLWRESIDDIKTAISKGYRPTAKLAKKIFERNAAILIRDNSQQIEQGVQQVAAKKSEDAKLKAQLASQSNYEGKQHKTEDLLRMDPQKLFDTLTGKKR